MVITLFKGITTGLVLSLPFGPVGIYCMEKTVTEGQKSGYIASLGMVTIDIIYGIIALLFISRVEEHIIKYSIFLQALIGIFLLFLGLKKLNRKTNLKKIEYTSDGIIKGFFTTFFLAMFNISGILVILAIFTMLRVYEDAGKLVPMFLGLGILLGGAGEWFATTYFLSHFSKTLQDTKLLKISKFMGGVICIFSLVILINSILKIIKLY